MTGKPLGDKDFKKLKQRSLDYKGLHTKKRNRIDSENSKMKRKSVKDKINLENSEKNFNK